MPLIRRLPTRGFNTARHAIRYAVVNLDALSQFPAESVVDGAALNKIGLAKGPIKRLKILGDGELKHKLTVRAMPLVPRPRARSKARAARAN